MAVSEAFARGDIEEANRLNLKRTLLRNERAA
jgi:hypothetical protein